MVMILWCHEHSSASFFGGKCFTIVTARLFEITLFLIPTSVLFWVAVRGRTVLWTLRSSRLSVSPTASPRKVFFSSFLSFSFFFSWDFGIPNEGSISIRLLWTEKYYKSKEQFAFLMNTCCNDSKFSHTLHGVIYCRWNIFSMGYVSQVMLFITTNNPTTALDHGPAKADIVTNILYHFNIYNYNRDAALALCRNDRAQPRGDQQPEQEWSRNQSLAFLEPE